MQSSLTLLPRPIYPPVIKSSERQEVEESSLDETLRLLQNSRNFLEESRRLLQRQRESLETLRQLLQH